MTAEEGSIRSVWPGTKANLELKCVNMTYIIWGHKEDKNRRTLICSYEAYEYVD